MTITESTDTAIAPIEALDTAPEGEVRGDAGAAQVDTAALDGAPAAEADTPSAEIAPVSEAAPDATTDDDAGPAAETEDAVEPRPRRERTPRAPRGDRAPRAPRASAPGGSAHDRRTTAQRLGNFPRADRPAEIAAPEHHHLPGWVRRDFARARPPLSNILALLEGDVQEQYGRRIAELTEGISSGRFSLAWQYPDLVDEGRALYEKQRRENAEGARANRQLDNARRRVQERIRDAGDGLAADVAARLQRQLRTAATADEVTAVVAELDGVITVAKTSAEKRREREIERTRARIQRSAAAAGVVATEAPQSESWQDVLRRFAEQQAAGSRASE